MLELKKKETIDLTADDLLSTENFVKLFSNFDALKKNGRYDENSYKEKFKINFGTKAEEQYPILEIAMPDAKLKEIQELFNKIEKMKTIFGKIPKDKEPKQVGGLHNPFSKGSNATKAYKKETEIRMPNQIQYSCYAQMTMSFCHACYLGVSYVMVLRLPNISEGKLRKEPTKDYTLYQKDGRIFSLPSDSYTSNSDCTKIESNVRNNNNTGKKGSFMNGLKGIFKKKNKNNNTNTNTKTKKGSFMNGITGFFEKKNTKTTTRSNNTGSNTRKLNNETTPLIKGEKTVPEEKGGLNCSIL
jgi:hypothetical protein